MTIQLSVIKNAEKGPSVLVYHFIVSQRLLDGINLLYFFMTNCNCEYSKCITAYQTTGSDIR